MLDACFGAIASSGNFSVLSLCNGLNIMTSQGKRPAPLGATEVRKVILRALSNEGSYRETWHAKLDHLERGISFSDVLFGLKQEWRSCTVEEFSEQHWQWKYRIRTVDVEGELLTVIVALDPRNHCFEIVTRFHD